MIAGEKLYALHDENLNGFLTWMEKGTSAILLFTTGGKAEEYINMVYPKRPLSVYAVHKTRMTTFVESMIVSGLEYAVIDLPWQHADWTESYEDDVVRDYAIVDLRMVKARFT